MSLVLKLDEEGKRKEKEAKYICQCAIFREILLGGELISCSDFRGTTPKERLYVNIGFVWNGEICPATEFYKRVDGKYDVKVNLDKMKECNYCRSLTETK